MDVHELRELLADLAEGGEVFVMDISGETIGQVIEASTCDDDVWVKVNAKA